MSEPQPTPTDLAVKISADMGIAPHAAMTPEQEAEFRARFRAALREPLKILPSPRPLDPDEIRVLLRECVTVVGPGETLIIRAHENWTASQMRHLQEVINSIREDWDLPFRTLIVPGAGLGVAKAGHEHEWKRCPNCPHPDQACACAGVPCCDAERAEIVADLESAGD